MFPPARDVQQYNNFMHSCKVIHPSYLVHFDHHHLAASISKVKLFPDPFDEYNRVKITMSFVPASYGSLPEAALQALAEVTAREDPAIVGIVLTGSAARGMATQHADIDVIVIRDEPEGENPREATRSPAIDEVPLTLAELETIKPIGSDGTWEHWSFAWARVLRDSSGGRVLDAVRR